MARFVTRLGYGSLLYLVRAFGHCTFSAGPNRTIFYGVWRGLTKFHRDFCCHLACLWPDRRNFADLGLKLNRRWWLDLLGGLALGAILMTAIFAIEYQRGWLEIKDSMASTDETREMIQLQIHWLLAMIFIGTGEEIMSRGYHLKNLTEGLRKLGFLQSFVLATLISSSVFGILHMMNPNATIIGTVGVFFAGIMFCVGRLCTGSLAAPIGMHISWNYFQGAVFGFPVSGQSMKGSFIENNQVVDSIWTGGKFGPEAGLLGLFAIFAAIVIFALWPRKKTNWRENLVELIRLRRRKPGILAAESKPGSSKPA